MFNAPPDGAGATTSGGTESILMACLGARQKAYAERGVTEPEMYAEFSPFLQELPNNHIGSSPPLPMPHSTKPPPISKSNFIPSPAPPPPTASQSPNSAAS